jgi:3-deoxy-manno-octulosonate cytidylyltransferase (CMP-KDO synthetase)
LKAFVIIPARYAASRLPGKPLVEIDGKPMIRHVYERACEALPEDRVVVATDDARIVATVEAFGGRAVMTSEGCESGTDRVAEATWRLVEAGVEIDAVVNVQGDEPFLAPEAIGELLDHLAHDTGRGRAPMATLARDLEPGESDDPSVVKVVCDREGYALYFSRAPLGRDRDDPTASAARAHVGLYAYTRPFLKRLAALPRTPLERTERLEQLRALEHRLPIAVGHTRWRALGVDTPEDLERARAMTG